MSARAALGSAALILAVFLSGLGPAAAGSPSTVSIGITSSAIPVTFAGENFTYQTVASVTANWTATAVPYGVLSSFANVQYASVRASPIAGVHAYKIYARSGTMNSYQNWSVTTYALPFIYSIPYFTPNAGDFYNYTPATTGSGALSITGAPWLPIGSSSATHGYASGTVQNGNWTEALTLNTTAGNFTQYWPLTTSSSVPTLVSFTCWIGFHQVRATISVTDGYPAGCGNEGLFTGEYPLLVPSSLYGTTTPYVYSDVPVAYGIGPTIQLGANVTSAPVVLWYYASAGSSGVLYANGAVLTSVGAFPSGGFVNASITPAYPGPTSPTGACVVQCHVPPGHNSTSNATSCAWFACLHAPAVSAGAIVGTLLVLGGLVAAVVLRRGGWWFLGALAAFAGVVLLVVTGSGAV